VSIVGVNASGRKDGNTAALVNAVLRGAAESGAESTLLQLADMDIAGCNACRACKATQRCVIRDDMDRFYDLAPATDVLVFASPIYLDHVTAQAKAFLDRLYCYISPNMEKLYPRPDARVVIGITYGARGKHQYDDVLDWLTDRFSFYWGIRTVGSFAVPAAGSDGGIDADHPVLRAACELGRSLT